jgi:D-arabinose 1-dehydrogenase-like Zn-dependent alcohol dehydrogenase
MTQTELQTIRKLIKKWALAIIAFVGLGGLGTAALAGAKAWSAVLMVDQHESRLQSMEMNNYLTCVMVKQLYGERTAEIKLTLDIDLACQKPGVQ